MKTIVELPLRIDLAGGWSDTPPICNEMGGAVLNCAVTLEGVRPVRAEVRRIEAKEVRVTSRDLRQKCVIRTRGEIYAKKDPSDWCALVKSALTVTGYEFADGGLDIAISAAVPKGSGMGTSSILSAALLTALQRTFGRPDDPATVGALTLALEKEMRTGGGWQDQFGALVPGVKLLVTRPGAVQKVSVRTLSEEPVRRFRRYLKERSLLYFTGQKRMARNVLQGVLGFYAENPHGIAKAIVKRLKDDAEKAYAALSLGEFDLFASRVNDYWVSKKALDPGSTNPVVESIIARISPWTQAVTLCGAGGGGFMFILARSSAAKRRIREVLAVYPAVPEGRFYGFDLD